MKAAILSVFVAAAAAQSVGFAQFGGNAGAGIAAAAAGFVPTPNGNIAGFGPGQFGPGPVIPRPAYGFGGAPYLGGGDRALRDYCVSLNIDSRRLPIQCQSYCNARNRSPWWC